MLFVIRTPKIIQVKCIAVVAILFAVCSCDNSSSENALQVSTTYEAATPVDSPVLEINLPQRTEPKPIATDEDRKHCLIVERKGFTLIMDGNRYEFGNEEKLIEFLKSHRQSIISKEVTVISDDPRQSYENLVDAFDALTLADIKHYKIANSN